MYCCIKHQSKKHVVILKRIRTDIYTNSKHTQSKKLSYIENHFKPKTHRFHTNPSNTRRAQTVKLPYTESTSTPTVLHQIHPNPKNPPDIRLPYPNPQSRDPPDPGQVMAQSSPSSRDAGSARYATLPFAFVCAHAGSHSTALAHTLNRG